MSLAARRTAFVLVLSFVPWLLVPGPAAEARIRKPNIIFILADDQTVGTLGPMRNVRSLIQRQGTRYTSAYISNPICCPSRASILTGLYSHTNLTYTNQDGEGTPTDPWERYGGAYAFEEVGNNETRTLAYALDQGGYYTGLVGKYLNGYGSYADVFHGDGTAGSGSGWKPAGWDRWVAFYEDNGLYYDYRLNVDGRVERYGSRARDHSTKVLGDQAVAFIQERPADQPFFLYFSPYAAHSDFTPEPRDTDRFLDLGAYESPAVGEDVGDKPTYVQDRPTGQAQDAQTRIRVFQTLYGLDRQVGRIIRSLSDRDLANTIIVYMSDNGLGNGEHNWSYKIAPYERVINVPLIIRGPGIPVGARDDSFVLNVDLMPTLLAMAGVARLPTDGAVIPSNRKRFLLEAMYYPRERGSVPTYCGIVTRRWKYVVYSPTPAQAPIVDADLVHGDYEEELYDRKRDPWELTNVASSRLARVQDLRVQLSNLCAPAPPDTTARWWNAWAA